jgi:hypothetical protein
VGDGIWFRTGGQWNRGNACLAKTSAACICRRTGPITMTPFAGRNPHSRMHTAVVAAVLLFDVAHHQANPYRSACQRQRLPPDEQGGNSP